MGACIKKVLCIFMPLLSPLGCPKTGLVTRIERDQVGNGDEIVLLGAGEAKRKLYEVRLDPQYWYDKAIERSWNDIGMGFGCPQNHNGFPL